MSNTEPASDLTPSDDPWQFTVDEMPTTDDTDSIAALLASRLGMDLPDADPDDLDAPQDGEIEAVLANPPTAGDVMPAGDVDEQDIDAPLPAPAPAPAPSAPQAGDTGSSQSATAEDPEPTEEGDLIWADADEASLGQVPSDTPTPDPASPAASGVIDTYFATAYGETDPRQTIERIEENLSVVRAIESLPLERQQVLGALIRGESRDQYIQAIAPQTPPTPAPPTPAAPEYITVDAFDEWGNPKQYQVPVPATQTPTVPTPAAPTATDPRVDMLLAQQEAQRAQQTQQGVQTAVQQFRAAHPELSQAEIAQLAQQVTARNAWAYEARQGLPVDEVFRRHMEGNLAIDPELSAKTRVAQRAAVPAAAPPDPTRPARSAAIAGSSTPSTSARRRSVVGGGAPTPSAPAKNRADLARQIQQAIDGAGTVAAN
jgi:hypothetical protein